MKNKLSSWLTRTAVLGFTGAGLMISNYGCDWPPAGKTINPPHWWLYPDTYSDKDASTSNGLDIGDYMLNDTLAHIKSNTKDDSSIPIFNLDTADYPEVNLSIDTMVYSDSKEIQEINPDINTILQDTSVEDISSLIHFIDGTNPELGDKDIYSAAEYLVIPMDTLSEIIYAQDDSGSYFNEADVETDKEIQLICKPKEEVCDNQDNDCDGETDEGNVCKPVCANACDYIDQNICSSVGNGFETCYDYNNDGCLEWGNYQSCDSNQSCDYGECKTLDILQPPQVVFDQFVSALPSGDLEKVLGNFDPFVKDKYKTILQSKDLNQESEELSGVVLALVWEGKRFAEYIITKPCTGAVDTICPGKEACTNGQCEGEYPIIFIKTYENGTETWKITNL